MMDIPALHQNWSANMYHCYYSDGYHYHYYGIIVVVVVVVVVIVIVIVIVIFVSCEL